MNEQVFFSPTKGSRVHTNNKTNDRQQTEIYSNNTALIPKVQYNYYY